MTTTLVDVKDAATRIVRFDVVQRIVHWVNALLFFALIATAIPLYFGSFFGVQVQRHTMAEIHLWCGLSLPLPVLISLTGRWGRLMRADLRRVSYWTQSEISWLRTFGRTPLAADKFNPGQKLNTLLVGASIFVMLVTGSMLQWFRFFAPSLRTGATLVHDIGTFAVVALIVGHIFMALIHVESLKSIFNGYVSRVWASDHAPNWVRPDDPLSNDSESRDSSSLRP